MTFCPSPDTIQSFVAGGLSLALRHELEVHLDACPACSRLVAQLLNRLSEVLPEPARAPTVVTAGEADAPPGALVEGQRVGRFILLGPLGAGGMGVVHAAYDTVLDRKIALKFLTGTSADMADRLLAEAGAMARLSHPNVVTVHDVGRHAGQPYLAMEFVEGQTLSAWRRARPRALRELLAVMIGAARGLAAAHAAGVIHRDVKPSNVLVSGGRARVTDFGISLRQQTGAPGRPAGVVAGTPGYMAPEQRLGEPVDARSDVYGFCATLQEMLQSPLPPRAPAWLLRVAARGTATDPAQRYPTMNAVVAALQANPAARQLRLTIGAAAVIGLVAAFLAGGYRAADPERRCQAGASVIDGSWSEGHKPALRRLFTGAGLAATWSITERQLDRYARGWREGFQQNCAERFGRQSQSDDAFDLRVACLQGRRVALQTFVRELPAVPASKLSTAATASAGLPALAECQAPTWPGKKPLPPDATVRARIAAADAAIEESVAQLLLGNYRRAGELTASALAAARQLGYQPLLARALSQSALTERRRGGLSGEAGPARETAPDRAARMFEEAFAVAELGRDDLRRGAVARELAMTNLQRARYPEAERWGELASAILGRLGDPPYERAALEMNLGWLALQLSQRERAAAAFTRASELRRRIMAPDDPELVSPAVGLCEVEETPAEQLRCYRDLVPLARRLLGPAHPDFANLNNNLAGLLFNDRRTLSEACTLFREALQILRRNMDASSDDVLRTQGNLANCLHETGELAEARRLYQDALVHTQAPSLAAHHAHIQLDYSEFLADTGSPREGLALAQEALARRIALFGPNHDKVVWTRSVLADQLVQAGRPDQALNQINLAIRASSALGERGLRLAELEDQRGLLLQTAWRRHDQARQAHRAALAIHQRLGTAEADRHATRHGLGLAQLGLGSVHEAVDNLERALAARAAGAVSPDLHADTAFALARALVQASGRRVPRACELARTAAAAYRATGGKRRKETTEVDRWLRARRCPANPTSALLRRGDEGEP
jgi:tetratricopeptide (TPR) repeat protein